MKLHEVWKASHLGRAVTPKCCTVDRCGSSEVAYDAWRVRMEVVGRWTSLVFSVNVNYLRPYLGNRAASSSAYTLYRLLWVVSPRDYGCLVLGAFGQKKRCMTGKISRV